MFCSFWHLLKIGRWGWDPYYSFWPVLIILSQSHVFLVGVMVTVRTPTHTFWLQISSSFSQHTPEQPAPERSAFVALPPRILGCGLRLVGMSVEWVEESQFMHSVGYCLWFVVSWLWAHTTLHFHGLRCQFEMINHHTKSKSTTLKILYPGKHSKMMSWLNYSGFLDLSKSVAILAQWFLTKRLLTPRSLRRQQRW